MKDEVIKKIEHTTPDITQENIERLTELFPQVATEVRDEDGAVREAVDFDTLRDLLGGGVSLKGSASAISSLGQVKPRQSWRREGPATKR